MGMTINTNALSIQAQRHLSGAGQGLGTTMQRLSSGLRINSAKDDAAGLAISERMKASTKGLAVAVRNVSDGISLAQTAEGALGKVSDMLQRMRELAVQASNATNSADDRKALQAEVVQLRSEVDRVAKTSSFNGKHLLDGSFGGAVFQVGSQAGDHITVGALQNTTLKGLGTVKTGAKSVEIPVGRIDQLEALGGLGITVGDAEMVRLDTLDAATSQSERLGQLVAAINAKTTDTGVTAFLETEATGKSTLSLRSDSDQTVTLSGGSLNSVGFLGAVTEIQKGSLSTSTDPLIVRAQEATDVSVAKTLMKSAADAYGISTDGAFGTALTHPAIDIADLRVAFNLRIDDFSRSAAAGALDIETVDSRQGIDGLSLLTQAKAWDALKSLDSAIDQVNAARGSLGALQTRFEKTVENIDIQSENITAARGRIVDADVASETANLSRSQILQQAGTAMVAQANQLPQQVLSLLR